MTAALNLTRLTLLAPVRTASSPAAPGAILSRTSSTPPQCGLSPRPTWIYRMTAPARQLCSRAEGQAGGTSTLDDGVDADDKPRASADGLSLVLGMDGERMVSGPVRRLYCANLKPAIKSPRGMQQLKQHQQ